jgi:uncharacterized membrane protein HdeD (DUF308 family)
MKYWSIWLVLIVSLFDIIVGIYVLYHPPYNKNNFIWVILLNLFLFVTAVIRLILKF